VVAQQLIVRTARGAHGESPKADTAPAATVLDQGPIWRATAVQPRRLRNASKSSLPESDQLQRASQS